MISTLFFLAVFSIETVLCVIPGKFLEVQNSGGQSTSDSSRGHPSVVQDHTADSSQNYVIDRDSIIDVEQGRRIASNEDPSLSRHYPITANVVAPEAVADESSSRVAMINTSRFMNTPAANHVTNYIEVSDESDDAEMGDDTFYASLLGSSSNGSGQRRKRLPTVCVGLMCAGALAYGYANHNGAYNYNPSMIIPAESDSHKLSLPDVGSTSEFTGYENLPQNGGPDVVMEWEEETSPLNFAGYFTNDWEVKQKFLDHIVTVQRDGREWQGRIIDARRSEWGKKHRLMVRWSNSYDEARSTEIFDVRPTMNIWHRFLAQNPDTMPWPDSAVDGNHASWSEAKDDAKKPRLGPKAEEGSTWDNHPWKHWTADKMIQAKKEEATPTPQVKKVVENGVSNAPDNDPSVEGYWWKNKNEVIPHAWDIASPLAGKYARWYSKFSTLPADVSKEIEPLIANGKTQRDAILEVTLPESALQSIDVSQKIAKDARNYHVSTVNMFWWNLFESNHDGGRIERGIANQMHGCQAGGDCEEAMDLLGGQECNDPTKLLNRVSNQGDIPMNKRDWAKKILREKTFGMDSGVCLMWNPDRFKAIKEIQYVQVSEDRWGPRVIGYVTLQDKKYPDHHVLFVNHHGAVPEEGSVPRIDVGKKIATKIGLVHRKECPSPCDIVMTGDFNNVRKTRLDPNWAPGTLTELDHHLKETIPLESYGGCWKYDHIFVGGSVEAAYGEVFTGNGAPHYGSDHCLWRATVRTKEI